MRITQIFVADLFGMLTHTIPLKLEERITIIHGPNGIGKTVLLQLLYGLFNADYAPFYSLPFKDFTVSFDDKSSLRVTKKKGAPRDKLVGEHHAPHIVVSYIAPNRDPKTFSITEPKQEALQLFFSTPRESLAHDPGRHRADVWQLAESREWITSAELPARIRTALSGPIERQVPEPDWFTELKATVNIKFIDTHRLQIRTNGRSARTGSRRPSMTLAVTAFSEDLAREIQRTLAESAELSQSLDRTFPRRLVSDRTPQSLTVDELRRKLSELEEKRSRLMASGLLDKEQGVGLVVPPQIEDRDRAVLTVYVRDAEQKLGVFDDISERIQLLQRIINERFLYKQITISKDRGFAFRTSTGSALSAASLSSGEQHELVLFYTLLFKVKPNSLILIDEPELSLHVAWQQQFLEDLYKVAQLSSFDVLIATHSPQIINDRWDLTVGLAGPKE